MPGFADAYGINLPTIDQAVAQKRAYDRENAKQDALSRFGAQAFAPGATDATKSAAISQLGQADPAAALQYGNAFAQQRKAAQDLQQQDLERAGQFYGSLSKLPDDQIVSAAKEALAAAKSHGADTSQIEPLIARGNPAEIRQYATTVGTISMTRAQQLAQGNADRTYNAGRSDHADTVNYQNRSLAIQQQNANTTAQKATVEGASLSPDSLRGMGEQYLAGDKSVLNNLGRGASGEKDRIGLRNEIYRQAKERGWNGQQIANAMAEFTGLSAGERTLGTRSAQAGMAVNELLPMIDQAQGAMANVSRSGFLPWGKVQQAWQNNTNDPNLRRAHAAVEAVVNTWARAINPSGQGTDADKRRGEDMLSTAFDQKSFNAVLDQMKQEANAAKNAPAATKQEMRDNFNGKPPQTGSVIHYDTQGNRVP